jgi:hypothetical protein
MPDWSGTLATFAALHAPTATELLTWHDALDALTNTWTDWSSNVAAAWTGGTNPVAGNATIASSYVRSGKFVNWQGSIFMGSTTTFGTGTWQIAWPITPAAAVVSSAAITGSAYFFDNSLATNRQAGICVSNGTAGINFYPGGAQGIVTNLVPFTWAVSDRLAWNIAYQAA